LTAKDAKEARRLGKGEFLRVFFASFAVFAVNKLVLKLLEDVSGLLLGAPNEVNRKEGKTILQSLFHFSWEYAKVISSKE